MEQQQNNQQMPQKPVERGGRRFLRIFGPILVKMLVVYIVTIIFMTVLMGQYFAEHLGLDSQSIMEYMSVKENYYRVQNDVLAAAVPYTTIMEGVAAFLTLPVLFWMFLKDRAKDKMMGRAMAKKAEVWKYPAIVIMSVALCVGINNLLFISNLASLSAQYESTMETLYSPSLGIQIVCLGILTPLCEEMVFRGLMFKRLREYSGYVSATLMTAFIFSFSHINIVQTVYAFFMALVFSFLYEKYGSVKAPIISHITANVAAIFATEYKLFDWVMADSTRAMTLTVVSAFVAATMYVFIQRMDEIEMKNTGKTREF